MSGESSVRSRSTLPAKTPTVVAVDDAQLALAAKSIIEIAEVIRRMRVLAKDKLIVLLLHDMTDVPKRSIQAILDAAPELARTYLQPTKANKQ
jgi:hypothetical protein